MSDKITEMFLAEAQDLMLDLERALLEIEKDFSSKECISAIFRAMHTLKGAAGMFGFDHVTSLTHHLESIYQDIRDDKRTMTDSILRVTFKTLDQLRILLASPSNARPSAQYEELLVAVRMLEDNNESANYNLNQNGKSCGACTYYVHFLPHANTLKNGTNPLYLIDDLLIMGEGYSFPFFHSLPVLENLSPSICSIGFEVLLVTDKPLSEIEGVFIFLNENSDIKIQKLADGNILKTLKTDTDLFANRNVHSPIGLAAIQNIFLKTFKDQPSEIKASANQKTSNIRVSTESLDDLMNLVSELVTTQARLTLFSNENSSAELSVISENIEKITRRLRDNAFAMSLVPVESLVVRFHRLVSDLSKELAKDIEFNAEGVETKIDKSVIEKITDPILHILRNCIDHGIESADERKTSGKPLKGTVYLKAYYSGANVIIEIGDDGAGLNLKKIREKAIKQKLIDEHAELTEKELTELIFLPGLSTASSITGVSGRGVGMDVVKRNITDLRGEVEISTSAGKGTAFIIRLPLTLSILDGLLVKIGKTDFILPLTSVAKCYEVQTAALESSYNQWITLDGKRTPFLYLRRNFEIHEAKPILSQIINIAYNGTHVGIVVDRIEGEYQAVLKPMGHFYRGQDEFSGATILGNGSVALVLDPNKLVRNLSTEIK
jgi:two-component system, chemotaxis family, sensor kinase CheA